MEKQKYQFFYIMLVLCAGYTVSQFLRTSIGVLSPSLMNDFNINPKIKNFKPNLWIDISKQIKQKIKILKIYKTEIGKHPFPRSIENIVSYAKIRGSVSGHSHAEAFQIIKEIQ